MHNNRRAVGGSDSHSDSEPDMNPTFNTVKRRKWTMQGVVEHYMKDRIKTRAEELSKAERGTGSFLSSYRLARTEICNGLSQEERQRYRNLADKWNKEPVPADIQRG
jgi:hypothetical protein